jgi:hypothetical protein
MDIDVEPYRRWFDTETIIADAAGPQPSKRRSRRDWFPSASTCQRLGQADPGKAQRVYVASVINRVVLTCNAKFVSLHVRGFSIV